MVARRQRARKCGVCDVCVVAPTLGYLRRYNCATGGVAKGATLPPACWQKRYPTFGKIVLAAMPAVVVNDATARKRHLRYLAMAEAVASLAEQGRFDVDAVTELVREQGLFRVLQMRTRLPAKSLLVKAIDEAIRLGRWHKPSVKKPKVRKVRPPKPARPVLPPEFEKAIAEWKEFSEQRAQRMLEGNNRYDPGTVPRRVEDARRFLEYLHAEGVTDWANLAQRHVDAYVMTTNRSAAQRAYTFLRFAKRRFRFKSQVVRPKDAKRNMLEDIATEDQVRVALENARKHPDAEESLIVFFVTVYGQTVTNCAKLTTDRVHRTPTGIAVEFHEMPVPLDEETAQLVRGRLDALPPVRAGARLFQRSAYTLDDRTRAMAQCPTKKLRLAGIANIMREGYTDRRGLVRGLGVSVRTLKLVEPIIAWDLQDSVSDEAAELRSDLLRGRLR